MPTYTTRAKVKNKLNSSPEYKIRFSGEALKELVLKDLNNSANTDMIFDQSEVAIGDAFFGEKRYLIEFTSATDFNYYKLDLVSKQKRLIGSSDIASATALSATVTVNAAAWGGTIENGDKVELRLFSHMSNDMVDDYIDETEVVIDSILSEGSVDYLLDGETRLFEAGSIPPAIEVATTLLSAFYLYTDVYRDKFLSDDQFVKSYSTRWERRAKKMLESYIKSSGRTIPKVLSFPSFIDQFGVTNIGPGMDTIQEDEDDITRDAAMEDIWDK